MKLALKMPKSPFKQVDARPGSGMEDRAAKHSMKSPEFMSVTEESEKEPPTKQPAESLLRPRTQLQSIRLSSKNKPPRQRSASHKLSQAGAGSENPPTAIDNSKENTIRTASHQGFSLRPSMRKTMNEPMESYNDKIHRAIQMFRQVSPRSNQTKDTKLEDLRRVFNKDQDQKLKNNDVAKQKKTKAMINKIVPHCLQKYVDNNIENYQKLKENPNFVMKTLTVCQECYLRITEFYEEAGAPGGA